ncbi:MAG: SAM-dependent methyltransferase, partial [Methanomicrobiales archaeon HGW-Methanomicrobiales-4]
MARTTSDLKEVIRVKWDGSSEHYDSQHAHGIQTEEERNAWKKLIKSLIPQGSLDVLDVGCGTGEISFILAEMGHNVHGIDFSEGMLSKARDKAERSDQSLTFSHGDAESLLFEDHSFDLVINRHLLWTLGNPQKAISEWKRVLRPGGTVAVIDALWCSPSTTGLIRRFASKLCVLLLERKNTFGAYYPPELLKNLPHPYGMDAETALTYVRDAPFAEVTLIAMKEIMDIQRRHMPISHRISYQMPYYLISG